MSKIKKQSQKKFAVFDIDGTIFRSSLLIEFVDGLIAAGIFPPSAPEEYKKEYKRWLERKGSYRNYLERIIEIHLKYIKGKYPADIEKVSKQVVSFHKNRVYRFTRGLSEKLKKTHYLLAISGSPAMAAQEFGSYFGFNKVYGRVLEIGKDGRYTGKISHEELISDKKKILKRAMEKENLTLKNSIGVGDTEADIPFLEMVSRPIAFNPNKDLYKEAKKRGWEIVVERKDVIYRI